MHRIFSENVAKCVKTCVPSHTDGTHIVGGNAALSVPVYRLFDLCSDLLNVCQSSGGYALPYFDCKMLTDGPKS